MALKFFADHCVPNSVMEVLREGGHDVLRVKDKIPTDSPDPVVIAKAQELRRTHRSAPPHRTTMLRR